ncbi:MAG: hypothetical protein KAR03_07095, partial [Candidatus Thorarchaeota archaeon]|nr:hypothetical protein [Candidatus Thorarchaeota archaeon]
GKDRKSSWTKGLPVTRKTSRKLLDHFIVLSEATRYSEGKHRVPFSFRLPDSGYELTHNYSESLNTLLPSYAGMNAQITYTIYAKLDLSIARRFSAKIPVTISISDEGVKKKPIKDAVYDIGASILDIEAPTQLYCTGSPYELRFRSNSRHRTTKIIFEISHGETTTVLGIKEFALKVLSQAVVVPEGNIFGWQTVVLPSQHSTVKTFNLFEMLRSYVSLGITVERYKQSKLGNTIRLLSLRCPETLKTQISPKPGSKVEAHNSCPHCGSEMAVGGMVRPDGLVICPNCFKKFKPENV